MFGNTKVIKNDVKWICKTLKDNEKWKEKIEKNVGKCPAEERIGGLEKYDRSQNAKIDIVDGKVDTLGGNMSIILKILIPILLIIIGTAVKIIFFSPSVSGGEQEPSSFVIRR